VIVVAASSLVYVPANALSSSAYGPITEAVPATQFRLHPRTLLIVDEGAAAEL
jgi:hypothetical protein